MIVASSLPKTLSFAQKNDVGRYSVGRAESSYRRFVGAMKLFARCVFCVSSLIHSLLVIIAFVFHHYDSCLRIPLGCVPRQSSSSCMRAVSAFFAFRVYFSQFASSINPCCLDSGCTGIVESTTENHYHYHSFQTRNTICYLYSNRRAQRQGRKRYHS